MLVNLNDTKFLYIKAGERYYLRKMHNAVYDLTKIEYIIII